MVDEGRVLFNDALNTFYLRLNGVRHMVKNHSISEIGNPKPPHELLLYASSHRQDNTYHGLYCTAVKHWPEREIAQGVQHEGSSHCTMSERSYHGATSRPVVDESLNFPAFDITHYPVILHACILVKLWDAGFLFSFLLFLFYIIIFW